MIGVKFYQDVPKDLEGNLQYRLEIRERAQHDVGFQRALTAACAEDVLYFFNSVCWVYEPRPSEEGGSLRLPFITWPHQDPAILAIRENLGFRDIGVEKSRGEGASWLSVLLALQDWLFKPMVKIGMVSRTELAGDNPEDSDSLFWKIDWELEQLPKWMVPPFKRSLQDHTLVNQHTKARIASYSAVGDVASGGRATWFFMDELAKFPQPADREAMASTQHVTNSRLIVSTPKGAVGAYYDVMHEPSSMVKVVLDWKQNPTRNRGLYRIEKGEMRAVDPVNNPLPANYEDESKDLLARLKKKGYRIEGVDRSPWYDNECDRPMATPQNIAQELDRDYGGSQARIYSHEFFKVADATVKFPEVRGAIDYNEETLEPTWLPEVRGPVALWMKLDAQKRPPARKYVLGADVGAGQGGSYSSNSVLIGIDALTGEQVLEYVTNTTEPNDFADEAIAIAKWLNDATLGWEHAGPGTVFTKRVLDQRYPHIYMRAVYNKKTKAKTKEAGWYPTDAAIEALHADLSQSVRSGKTRLRSKELVTECGQYVRENGKIVHAGAKTATDDAKGKAHGDRVVAAGIAEQVRATVPIFKTKDGDEQVRRDPPKNSMAWRDEYHANLKREKEEVWDERTNGELMQAGWSTASSC